MVKAHVPVVEILKYTLDLRFMTPARGSAAKEISHHDDGPAQITQEVLAENKQAENVDR